MPTASSTLSVPSKPGTSRPCATPEPDGSARNTWNPKATTITPTNAAITASSLRKPRLWSAEDEERGDAGEERGREERQAREQVDPDRGADELGDVGRHRDQLGLDPEQERDVRRENRSRHTSGRFIPVAIPSLALIDWISIAIRFATSTTQRSR